MIEKYEQKKWRVFPLAPRSKVPPKGHEWTKPYNGEWRDDYNIGVALGKESENLVDVDLDWREAARWGTEIGILPRHCVFGRASMPGSHCLVVADLKKRIVFKVPKSFEALGLPDEHGRVVAEIRTNGCYTMFPPSVHPSGEHVEWVNDGAPPEIDSEKLIGRVGFTAFLAVVERFWGRTGSRHDCALSLCGILKHADVEESDCRMVVERLCKGDEELKDRLRCVDDTYKQGVVSGWDKFIESFGFPEDARATFVDWLKMAKKEAVNTLNDRFAIIRNKNKVGVLVEDRDPHFGRTSYSVISQSSFTLLENTKDAQIWLQAPGRRTYPNGFVFDPSRDHDGYLNLWQGWSIKPREGHWPLLRSHIENVLAHEAPEYAIKWLAWTLQNLSDPAEVALVFRGAKGSGKGTLGKALLRIVGQHGLHVSHPRHLVGNFNLHMRDCVVLFADEAFWAGDKQSEGTLKRVITEDTLVIEQKGVDVTSVKNMLHIMIASNEDWVVPASLDERRFAIFDVSDVRVGDRDYFRALNDEMANGGLAAMLHDLLAMNFGGWHPREDVPRTRALRDQIQASERPEIAALRSILDLGCCPGTYSAYHSRNELLFPEFRRRVLEHAFGRNVTDKAMSLALARIKGARKDANGEVVIGVDTGSGKPEKRRCRRYLMPPLAECRRMFDPEHEWPHTPSEWEWEHAVEGENDLPENVVNNLPF